jgi:glycerophosphoryl diester phosphodiesterase
MEHTSSRRPRALPVAVAVLVAVGGLLPSALSASAAPSTASSPATGQVAAGLSQRPFDAEGHRGTRGLRPENTLPAFAKALEIGVSTLEMDTGITRDGQVIVSHEPVVIPLLCQDTGPAFPGDPAYPYVGKAIHDLTLAEIKTLDCGTRRPADPAHDPYVGTQQPVPGTRMPTLDEVYDLADRYGATTVHFNVETKIDPTQPEQTAGSDTFTRKVTEVIERHRAVPRTTLQSFDWRTLRISERLTPRLRRVALVDASTAQVGQPGASPWLAGIDVDDYGGNIAAAARAAHAQILSPDQALVDANLVRESHHRGLPVVPWTTDDPAQMNALIDLGVDGIISDYPDRLRQVMADRHMRLPRAYPPPAS